jgi:hypothetical protein
MYPPTFKKLRNAKWLFIKVSIGSFTDICESNPCWGKIRQQKLVLYMNTYIYFEQNSLHNAENTFWKRVYKKWNTHFILKTFFLSASQI